VKRALMTILALLALEGAAQADKAKALFALIIGANQSVDRELPFLRYADDDAARYLDLFRSLGAKAYLLTRLDENTTRVHPQALAEAHPPRQHEFEQTVERLAAELAEARAHQVQTVFYFVYAGHGNVREGRGYITLEDKRLSGSDLEAAINRIGADQSHAIVDACFSYYLAFTRGPGGRRRVSSGFAELDGLGQRPSVGLLLSTASARESHEWEGFQAGVFSYEVRAGLLGAADADGDGQVSYREIAAFVARANQAIANERFRPDVYARPPTSSEQLVDLRGALERRLEIPPAAHGHYLLEDSRGVRVTEFHNSVVQPVHVLRPATGGALYLRRLDGDEREWVLPAMPDVLAIDTVAPAPPRVAARGAAHEAFSTIFSFPFDASAVGTTKIDHYEAPRPPSWPRRTAIALLSAGLVTVAAGAAVLATIPARPSPTASQETALEYNKALPAHGISGSILIGAGGASLVSAAAMYWWQQRRWAPSLSASAKGASIQLSGTF
jgi:hypothetical protein